MLRAGARTRLRTIPLSLSVPRTARLQKRSMTSIPRYIDIGVNLTDPVFRGSYHGKQAHPDDLETVVARAEAAGVVGQILTGGNLEESHEALALARRYRGCYSTAGCHPTRTSEMEAYPAGAPAYLEQIRQLILHSREHDQRASKVVAVGECGLDYDRLHFSPAEVQKKHFTTQLALAAEVKLPLFLHSRAAHRDFVDILRPSIDTIHTALSAQGGEHKHDASAKKVGVVHSFTGTADEVDELLQLGLFIGINGCSLKTQENLDVVQRVPLSRLMLETGSSSPLPSSLASTCFTSLTQDPSFVPTLVSPRCALVRPALDPCIARPPPVVQADPPRPARPLPAPVGQEGKVECRLHGQRPQRTMHDWPDRRHCCQRQVGTYRTGRRGCHVQHSLALRPRIKAMYGMQK